MSVSSLARKGLLVGGKLKGFERFSLEETAQIVKSVLDILRDPDFIANPKRYISLWNVERGPTMELRFPVDISHLFVTQNLGELGTPVPHGGSTIN